MESESKKGNPGKQKSLEQLVMEQATGKYALVTIASAWARELRKRVEFRHLSINEILEIGLKDVLTGRITWKKLAAELQSNHRQGEESPIETKTATNSKPKKAQSGKK